MSFPRIMPEVFSSILSDSSKKEKVLVQGEASDVLREAFSQTEACMNHYYEVFLEMLIFFITLYFVSVA